MEREHLEDMEKEIYVDRLVYEYEGVFSYAELRKLIRDWAADKDYYREIKHTEEKVTPKGRDITIEFQFQQKFTEKHWSVIYLELSIKDMEDFVADIDGKKTNLNKGKVELKFNGFLETSLKNRYETKGYVYFLREVIDKFVYKLNKPWYAGKVESDAKDLANKLQGLLNIHSKTMPIGEHKEETGEESVEEQEPEPEEENPEMPKTGAPINE